MEVKTHRIIVDSREQCPWDFGDFNTVVSKLDTGDYSIEGFEDKLCIERKGSILEFSTNLTDDRFERELDRMTKYKYRYIILEFSLEDLVNFPLSVTNLNIRKKLKMSGKFLLKKMLELQIKYNIHIYFADNHGMELAVSIFKRVLEN